MRRIRWPSKPSEPTTTTAVAGPQVKHPPFRAAYEVGAVSLLELVIANAMRYTQDHQRREVGEHDYPLLRKAFDSKHANAQLAIQDWAAVAACLNEGSHGELELVAIRNTLRYKWEDARELQVELNELDEDAKRWLAPKQCRNFRVHLFGLVTQLHATVASENHRHVSGARDEDPTDDLAPELDAMRPQIAHAAARLKEEAEKVAQVRYATGMGGGALALAIVFGIVGWQFDENHIGAVYGIGALAGAVGACLSVFQRLTTQDLKLDYRSASSMLRWFGALRPVVGAVTGMITFAIIKSGVVSNVIVVPADGGQLVAFVAVLAFLAAFSERFFQDMLRVVTPPLRGSNDEPERPTEMAAEP